MNRTEFVLAVALLCAIGLVMGVNSVTRVRHFTPDSMAYVDAARNLNAGHGLASSTAGLNQWHLRIEPAIPVPFTTYAPLYPVVVAGVARLGPEAADAALIVSALCWLAILALCYLLSRRAWGEAAARLAVAVLLFYAPLREASNAAWSEPLGLVFMLACLLALPPVRQDRAATVRATVAGVLAGLAFATRYGLVPLLAAGPLALFLLRPRAWRVREAIAFAGGGGIPALSVILRNRALEGAALPGAARSGTSVLANVGDATRILGGTIFGRFGWPLEGLAVAAIAAFALAIAWRRDVSPRPAVLRAFTGDGAVLVLWSVAYLVFLVVVRSLRNFDPIDMRLVLPAGVALVLVGTGFVATAMRLRPGIATVLFALSAAFVGVREVRNLQRDPPRTLASEVAASERLAWIASETTPRDLVIGDNAVDVSFYTGRHAVSFSPYPFTDFPTPEQVRAYAAAHRGEHARYWIVLSRRYERTADWEEHFGPWFARLAAGTDSLDAGLGPPLRLRDAIVYRWDPFAS